jgi:hypothetical protein
MPKLGSKRLKRASFSSPQLGLFSVVFAVIGAVVLISTFAASNPNLAGDLNNDNKVDAVDLSLLLSNFGTTNAAGDANSDGHVDAIDLSIILSHFGQSVAGGPTSTFGTATIGSSFTTGLDANDKFVEQFAVPQNGSVTKLTYYLKGDITSSQVAKAVIYADNNGTPGALLGQGTEVTVPGSQAAGWVDFPFASPVSVTGGSNVWIGLIRGDTAGNIDIATERTGGNELFQQDTYADGASNPYGTPGGSSTYDISGYATYTTSGGTPAPTVSLSASPTSITSGSSSTLTWSSTNATSCSASGAWSGSKATSGSASTDALSATSTYNLSCTGTGGTGNASATVTVTGGGTGPSINGRWYPSTSALNIPIPANPPIHPDSAAMINSPNWILDPSSPYKQWLGPRERYALSIQNTPVPTVPLKIDFNDITGYKCNDRIINTPIPSSWAPLFGDFSTSVSYDASAAIVTADGTEYDIAKVSAPGIQPGNKNCSPDSYWHALRDDTGSVLTGLGYCLSFTPQCPTQHASGSGMWFGSGLVLPQDTQTGQPYQHVLEIFDNSECGPGQPHPVNVPPAIYGDGVQTGTGCIPAGARIQLDPSIDVANWPSVKALPASEQAWMVPALKTMQTYGMITEDSTGCLGCGGWGTAWSASVTPYVYPWEAAGQGWGYGNGIPYDLMGHFRVIDWTRWTGT